MDVLVANAISFRHGKQKSPRKAFGVRNFFIRRAIRFNPVAEVNLGHLAVNIQALIARTENRLPRIARSKPLNQP